MNSFLEISEEIPCQCGSGKKYGDCCKNKRFKIGTKDDDLVKETTIDEEVMKTLEEIKKIFFEDYGINPGENDFVAWNIPIYNHDMLLENVYLFRELGFQENHIYAYYKSDGLLPCDINTDLLSQSDIEEFESLCKEYDELLNEELEGHINSIQYVINSDTYINEQVEYALEAIISSLNDLIRRHSGTNSIREYKITTEADYCIFSALKTVRTLQSINKLRETHLPECIYALSRGIFENYMYICNINMDSSLFKDKILPKVDEVNYTFDLHPDGRINYNKVINRKTKIKTPIRIIISNLKDNLPYDEIDPSLIASLIAIILATLLLSKISQNREIQTQYTNDVLYLCKNLSYKFINCLEIAKCDEEHTNEIFDLLLDRLKEQF
ncbi:SEC-C domain-containing protein [Proteiniborus sp. MB09-C3]|uniref:YecA family protein n=1 Tax=Proteiniborus sp. MB09-C3 TaxID=3050072 RepID=UPI0025534741|nr:SEC-C domain-containing protein [Proteiniborus sp. MB09-C3]WIV13641.1 SEC-C domain-containing protein [Proteiniborus sp. MB09-C3]